MTDFSVRIRGIAEIQRALFQFNKRLGERVTRLAMRKGANYMLKAVRSAAPVKSGRMKKAIKVRDSKIHTIRRNGNVGVYLKIKPGKKRDDTSGAWYGKFVENGRNTGSAHNTGAAAARQSIGLGSGARLRRDRRFVNATYRRPGAGRNIPGKHFILSTFNATSPTALAIMVEASEVAMRHLAHELNLNITG
ncbi:HK97-gp10 family putative phage morphogenesis protein [Methylobacter sp. S3L5C]|uniref:HK97-gp10 family putative phage morphogenesis protein n=1 Tax=Methylobacter sp. S3L5C TaxID=2839024 RepID=UPI001FAD2771|nr:HK97-gp10 family putative phage morphogenesis protein [Methylobacter sp. S3L5C]UOA08324.1 HK97 gp10 family phage protein [Methylobacter sp. S3L5C]